MTGKTSRDTYAVLEVPDLSDPSFIWTATIHRKGFKRTETLFAFTESALRERCLAKDVTRFVGVQSTG